MSAFDLAPVAGTAAPGPRAVRLSPWEVRRGDHFVHYPGYVTEVLIAASPLGHGLRYTFKFGTQVVTWRESNEFLSVFRDVKPAVVDSDPTPARGIDRPRHLHLVGGA